MGFVMSFSVDCISKLFSLLGEIIDRRCLNQF